MKKIRKPKHFWKITVTIIVGLALVGAVISDLIYTTGLKSKLTADTQQIAALNKKLNTEKQSAIAAENKYEFELGDYNVLNSNYTTLKTAVINYINQYNSSAKGFFCTSNTFDPSIQTTITSCK